MLFFARLLIYLLFLTLPILWLKRSKSLVLKILISVSFAYFIAEAIKYFFPLERPFVAYQLNPLVPQTADPTFPSQHIAIASAFAVSTIFENKFWGCLITVAAVTIGVARILALVHYPIDIVAGFLIGGVVAYIVHRLHIYF